MKLRKHISKLLVLGILINNIYFNSSANTEIPNRYQALEGEQITIDDSTEGELTEIEAFGNTAQDENNLEDIQSVGDLYVDENGSPILDSQGREQYKIDIVSTNLNNLLNYEDFLKMNAINTYFNPSRLFKINQDGKLVRILDYNEYVNRSVRFYLEPNQIYTLTMSIDAEESNNGGLSVYNATVINSTSRQLIFQTDNTGECLIKIYPKEKDVPFDVKLEKTNGSVTGLEDYEGKVYKNTILLPIQLQKVGDIADRLYWDNEKGRYVIEKNIEKINLKDLPWELYTYQQSLRPNTSHFVAYITQRKDLGTCITTYEKLSHRSDDNEEEGLYYQATWNLTRVFINISNSKLNSISVEDLLDVLGDNHYIYIDYPNPKLIETNITSKLQIPTYDGKTYVSVNTDNKINPTLKVTVDRLPQVAQNAVTEAESNSSLANISLARMYVNMLPESMYKDQLQEQLSQVFSSDIALDRKTATSNLDIYIKSENMLSISLDTNSVTFDGYSGAAPMELKDAVNITINSSLPYDLNAYMPTEISNSDGSSKIDFDIFNIKESTNTNYQQFVDNINKVTLKSDCVKGNGKSHKIDLKLDSNSAHKADIYKTVIRFEAQQK